MKWAKTTLIVGMCLIAWSALKFVSVPRNLDRHGAQVAAIREMDKAHEGNLEEAKAKNKAAATLYDASEAGLKAVETAAPVYYFAEALIMGMGGLMLVLLALIIRKPAPRSGARP